MVRYAKESEAITELAEKISSTRLRKDDGRSEHIVKALQDLDKLKVKLNGFVKETTSLHHVTSEILTNVGEATKFAREMRTALDESAGEKQQQLEHFQLLLPSPEPGRNSAGGLGRGGSLTLEEQALRTGRASVGAPWARLQWKEKSLLLEWSESSLPWAA